MQLKEFNILLDIKKHNKTDYFEVVQGDSYSNILNITLVDGLNSFNLTNTNVEIVFNKSDGTTVQQTDIAVLNAAQGKIQCILKTNTIASPGKVIAEVRVLEGETLLTSTRFEFYVRKSLITDETIESTNEFPLLTELINTTNGLIDQVEQIEKQVPENVVTELNQVSTLANQLQQDLIAHKAESASKHITESGGNENGRYIKFDDGTMVCYKIIDFISTTGITTESGALYSSEPTTIAPYASTFIDTPVVNVFGTMQNGNAFIRPEAGSGFTNTSHGAFRVLRPAPAAGERQLKFYIFAIGRWK